MAALTIPETCPHCGEKLDEFETFEMAVGRCYYSINEDGEPDAYDGELPEYGEGGVIEVVCPECGAVLFETEHVPLEDVKPLDLLCVLEATVQPLAPGEDCGLTTPTYNRVCAAIAKLKKALDLPENREPKE